MRAIINLIRLVKHFVNIMIGAVVFKFKQKTPEKAYQGMINLFCASRGSFNTFASGFINRAKGKYPVSDKKISGVLGNLGRNEVKAIVKDINRDGFYVFPDKLSQPMIDEIMNFALTNPAKVMPPDNKPIDKDMDVYDPTNPKGICYDLPLEAFVKTSAAQKFLIDDTLMQVAQEYIGCKPVVEEVSLRWTTELANQPSSNAAQLFHFDMDRFKWLKFFIYLTDVDENNGPHVFVRGSHQDKNIPASILKKGYARITDDEILQYYDKKDIVVFTGKAGTILAVDTRGLHKGMHISKGHRLLFQIQHSNSLFGGAYSTYQISNLVNPAVWKQMLANKESYPMYL